MPSHAARCTKPALLTGEAIVKEFGQVLSEQVSLYAGDAITEYWSDRYNSRDEVSQLGDTFMINARAGEPVMNRCDSPGVLFR